MFRRNFAGILAIVFIFVFTTSTIASEDIKIFINGKPIKTDVAPQIVDGRTMVPLRVVGETLHCAVTWDGDSRAVNIVSDSVTNTTPPEINGPDNFKTFIQNVLNLYDQQSYSWLIANINEIDYKEASDFGDSVSVIAKINVAKGLCSINGEYYEKLKKKYTEKDLKFFYAGILAHETNHGYLIKSGLDKVYNAGDVELLCNIAGLRVIQKLGGNNSQAETDFKSMSDERLNM